MKHVTQPARRRLGTLVVSALLSLTLLPALAQPQSAAPKVRLSTSMGDMVLELYPEKAPKTVENFLQYVRDKHYDGTIFHRVIDGFMVQGGGFTPSMQQKP
ncbi:MAG TPA: peptidylprolyl isomerase, partial [Hydrogenophaga sp.]|nr:peptidylprolyl isomerase [Hydrogenophaga sp.]